MTGMRRGVAMTLVALAAAGGVATQVAPAQAAGSACKATVNNAKPKAGAKETVTVTTTRSAKVRLVAHYKTKGTTYTGTANAKGADAITFSTGRPTKKYTVKVTVTTSSKQSCSTAFTPQ